MKTINISGVIGWDVEPSDIRDQLNAAKGDDLEINIASPGGSVFAGFEIHNDIRDYKRKNPDAQIIGNMRGIVASMGSYIAMNPAIDLLSAEDNAVFMIHNVWGCECGDYRDMEKAADVFKGLSNILATAYANRLGKTKEECQGLMDEEAWYFGNEIGKAGFCDEMIEGGENENGDSKASASLNVKAQLKIVRAKLNEKPDQLDDIAAMIKPAAQKTEQTPVKTVVNNTIPAQREKTEETVMSLKDLLSANPAAQKEHDEAVNAKFEAGKKSVQSAVDGAAKYLRPDSTYGKVIKNFAVDVLEGKKSIEALESAVAAVDAIKESQNSEDAKTESEAAGAQTGQQVAAVSPDGKNKTEADYQAMIAEAKTALGMEA